MSLDVKRSSTTWIGNVIAFLLSFSFLLVTPFDSFIPSAIIVALIASFIIYIVRSLSITANLKLISADGFFMLFILLAIVSILLEYQPAYSHLEEINAVRTNYLVLSIASYTILRVFTSIFGKQQGLISKTLPALLLVSSSLLFLSLITSGLSMGSDVDDVTISTKRPIGYRLIITKMLFLPVKTDPNHIAAYSAVMIILSFFLLQRKRSSSIILSSIYAGCGIAWIVVLAFTQSRSAIISLLISAIAINYRSIVKPKHKKSTALLVSLMTFSFFLYLFADLRRVESTRLVFQTISQITELLTGTYGVHSRGYLLNYQLSVITDLDNLIIGQPNWHINLHSEYINLIHYYGYAAFLCWTISYWLICRKLALKRVYCILPLFSLLVITVYPLVFLLPFSVIISYLLSQSDATKKRNGLAYLQEPKL